MPDDTNTSTAGSSGAAPPLMDKHLLAAATTGDTTTMLDLLAEHEPGILLATTPQKNNFLHIASIHGHEEIFNYVQRKPDEYRHHLLKATNADGETPLITAVTGGRTTLASVLLGFCQENQLCDAILRRDKHGFNALDHAIRSGHRKLALELIQKEPALTKADEKNYNESPMYIVVMRNYGDVFEKLLEIGDAANGCNALHAAVTSGNAVMAKRVMEKLPDLVRDKDVRQKLTPIMHLAVIENKIDVLTVLLEHDPSLGYLTSDGSPLLCTAAEKGNVVAARELLRHCLDPPYCKAGGSTCLHIAVSYGQPDFVRFITRSPQLQHLVNLPNKKGQTALQLAQEKMSEGHGQKREIMNVLQRYHNNLSINAEPFKSEMERFLKAVLMATPNHLTETKDLLVPGVLHGTTPQGNTCLHIAAIHGLESFCKDIQALKPSLLAAINSDGETPLLIAVANGRVSVASVLLRCCRDQKLSEAILKQDKRGCNVLHHAIRNGHKKLALELIEAKPALSHAMNESGESPMFVAAMRNYMDVVVELLKIPNSAHGGPVGWNALHAAVRNGNSGIATKIMQTLPALVREENMDNNTPLHLAAILDKTDMLRALLEHDRSLGYVFNGDGCPLLYLAANRGHVGVARELLKHCPDAPYTKTIDDGWTCLHTAVWNQQTEFIDFVLGLPQFRRLINMQNQDGDTALHLAVQKCNPKMVAALLLHPDIDVTLVNNLGNPANWTAPSDLAKTLNWNEVSMLIMKADPQDATSIVSLHKDVKDEVTDLSRKDIKSLTQTYTSNTSLVAILMATITFAAAFTLPGGYSTDAGNQGHPIFITKSAFKAFLISDSLAMCFSLAVAFICVIAKWEDLEFLLYYRALTKKLMWLAYMATTIAFATGLYTVLAPKLPWLAILICILTSLLPILTMIFGEWPIWRLRCLFGKWPILGQTFNSELLDMV